MISICAISSVVERHIDIVKAGGPIPPSRTTSLLRGYAAPSALFLFYWYWMKLG